MWRSLLNVLFRLQTKMLLDLVLNIFPQKSQQILYIGKSFFVKDRLSQYKSLNALLKKSTYSQNDYQRAKQTKA